MTKRPSTHGECPLELDRGDVAELVLGHVDESADAMPGRVVHDHMEVAEALDHGAPERVGTAMRTALLLAARGR